jgi:hypothetical protein
LTDRILTAYGQKIGSNYRLGTLTGALPHLQQLFLHEKLFNEDHYFGEKSTLRIFVPYVKLLLNSKRLPVYKKAIIAGWSLVVMLLPKSVAHPLVVLGYRCGVVLAVKRMVS